MPIKAVIFDLDGTITRPYFDFDAIRQQMGLPRDSGPVLESMLKMTPSQRRRAEQILRRHERQAVERSELNPGARETLSALRQMGLRIGVLTRNTRANVIAIAQKHDLRFDAIFDRDDGPVKPDSFGLLHLCRRFGVQPAQVLLVGDYLFDLLCAKAAGAVAVLLASNSRAEQFAAHADFCIENVSQILEIVEQSNRGSTF